MFNRDFKVEKVAHYESVHQIRSLSDLKHRLSTSRRCFVYTHSTMPYEPLVILHIALTDSISSNIKDLIRTNSANKVDSEFDANKCTNAIFYSINSCQKGLQQVDLGNALIKSCVRLLLDELPNLRNFHTLSPIPKFREWLDLKMKLAIESNSQEKSNEFFEIEKCLNEDEKSFLIDFFTTNGGNLSAKIRDFINSKEFKNDILSANIINSPVNIIISNFMMRSCAFYLYHEKKNGYAFNSVANFHLKNGAQIFRINFAGDLSDNGWNSS